MFAQVFGQVFAQVFVYYQADAAAEADLRRQIRRFQAELAGRFPGLAAELLVRADPATDGRRTWMETYRRPGGVDAACQAAIAAAAQRLPAGLCGPRHTEVFADVEPAADAAGLPPFTLYLRVRYGECDAQQVVFNARYADYADIATTEYLRHLYGGVREMLAAGIDTQVVRMATDFRAPARFDDVLALSVVTAAIGNTSFALTIEMREHTGGRLLATTHATHVTVSHPGLQKMRVPDALRQALARGGTGARVDLAGVWRLPSA